MGKRITFDKGKGKSFVYKGNIVCEDEHFISFNDRIIGLIRLRKANIISIEEWGDDDES